MKKRIVIQFCVTAKEKRAIKRAAKQEGYPLSDYLRIRSLPPESQRIGKVPF